MSGTAVDWRTLNLNLDQKRPGIATPRVREPLPRYPREVLDATRVLYRALKIHHTTARMAALALYHEGMLNDSQA